MIVNFNPIIVRFNRMMVNVNLIIVRFIRVTVTFNRTQLSLVLVWDSFYLFIRQRNSVYTGKVFIN